MTSYTKRGIMEHFAFAGDDSATNINRQRSVAELNQQYNETNRYSEDVEQQEKAKELYQSKSVKETDINETNAYRNYFKSNQNDKAVSNVMDITDIQMMTKDIQNIASAVTMKTTNSCKTGVMLNQDFNVKNVIIDYGDFIVDGVFQRQIAQVDFKCSQMNKVASDIRRKVQASIVNALANKLDSNNYDKVNENASRTIQTDNRYQTIAGATQGSTSQTTSESQQGATSGVSSTSSVDMGATTSQELGSTQTASSSAFANVSGYEYFGNRGYVEFFSFAGDDSSTNFNYQDNISLTNQSTTLDNQTDINKRFIKETDIQKDISNTDDFKSTRSDLTDIQTDQYLNSEKYKNDSRKLGQNINNIIQKNINDTFTDEKVNECAAEVSQGQTMGFENIRVMRGNFKLSNLHQDQALMLMASCVTGNDTVQSMLNDMTNDLGIKIDEDKKLTEVAERIRTQENAAQSSTQSSTTTTTAQTAAGSTDIKTEQSSASTAATSSQAQMAASTEQKATSEQKATASGFLSGLSNLFGGMLLIPIIIFLVIAVGG
ncbi:MAG: hypothetical protein RL208_394, partial [Pseudomonadota bacterium]